MATVESGDIIIKLNTIEISILIKTGCNSVKLLIILPIPVVIICTYGVGSMALIVYPTIVGGISATIGVLILPYVHMITTGN
jgi:uncharacterized membrane protein